MKFFGWFTEAKEPRFMPFLKKLVLTAESRIWTLVANYISKDNNYYAKSASLSIVVV